MSRWSAASPNMTGPVITFRRSMIDAVVGFGGSECDSKDYSNPKCLSKKGSMYDDYGMASLGKRRLRMTREEDVVAETGDM